jgi:hypothetical protein
MSHQAIADAMAPWEADYKEKVMQHTWGHLAPDKGKSYQGEILFALGEYGDFVPLRVRFNDLDDSPWFFQDMMELIAEEAKEPGIYRFKGEYRNHEFIGNSEIVSV